MKFRSRRFSLKEEEGNFWPSFVDVMSVVALVFFFVMIFFITNVYSKYKDVKITYEKLDNIAYNRAKLYEQLEEELKPKLKDNIVFDKENGKLEIKTEVLYEVDSYNLTEEGRYIARTVGEAFKNLFSKEEYQNKIRYIEVKGHTDNTYLSDYNRYLSTNRAASFINEMLKDDDSIYDKYFKASGMSKYEPKSGEVESQSENDKAKNRRIEINVELDDEDIEKAIKALINE